MKIEIQNILGLELEVWTHKSCRAEFGVGNNWATLYKIDSEEKRRGHATELMAEAKKYYEENNKFVGGTVALHPAMKRIYQKLKIPEYENPYFEGDRL